MSQPNPYHVADVASKFCELLRAQIGDAGVREAARRNKAEKSPDVCHSHDFCDANMVMADAFELVMKTVFDPQDQAQATLFNKAWDLAAGLNFRI